MKKFKILLSLLLATIASSDSIYSGKYLCNKSQIVEITQKNLYIGNATFNYNQTMKRHGRTTDIFLKGNEAALITPQPNWAGHYSLNIRNLKNKNKLPYVADCTKE